VFWSVLCSGVYCVLQCRNSVTLSLLRLYVSAYECLYLYAHIYVLRYRVWKDHILPLQNYITTHFDNPCDNNLGVQKRQQR
jgi:hypothetical protein